MSGEKLAEGSRFFDYLLGVNTLRDLNLEGTFANAKIINLVEPKRGGETVHIEGYDIFRADRWDYEQGIDGRNVKLKHGGAMLLVAERLQKYVVREISGSPSESVAVLFRGEPFGVDGLVAVLVIYGLCETTAAHQALVEIFGSTQLSLLADIARELRMAGYKLVIIGDLNA